VTFDDADGIVQESATAAMTLFTFEQMPRK